MRVYVGTCPACGCWLQSPDVPNAQPHYDACHDARTAPTGILARNTPTVT